MCNAYKHPPGCDCGWGRGYHGGGSIFGGMTHFSHVVLSSQSSSQAAIGEQPIVIRDAKTYTISCWWCEAEVYYHTNGFGDSVLFDSLGSPWQVHSCWIDNQEKRKKALGKRPASNAFSHDVQRMAILAGAISQIQLIPDEISVASGMGITLAGLHTSYGHLYNVDCSINGVKLKSIEEIEESLPPRDQVLATHATARIDKGVSLKAARQLEEQQTRQDLPPHILALQRPHKASAKPKKKERG